VCSGGARVLDQGGGDNFSVYRAPNFSYSRLHIVFSLKKYSRPIEIKKNTYYFIKSHEMFNFIIDKNLQQRD